MKEKQYMYWLLDTKTNIMVKGPYHSLKGTKTARTWNKKYYDDDADLIIVRRELGELEVVDE